MAVGKPHSYNPLQLFQNTVVDPLFWLGLSILLVAVSLTAVLVVALPALKELARAARSAEKLFDTLSRELPPTLEAIRLTGMEISDLTDDVSEGVQNASRIVKQVDDSVTDIKKQAQKAQTTTRSIVTGVRAAWGVFSRPSHSRRSPDRLPAGKRSTAEFEPYATAQSHSDSHNSDLTDQWLEEGVESYESYSLIHTTDNRLEPTSPQGNLAPTPHPEESLPSLHQPSDPD